MSHLLCVNITFTPKRKKKREEKPERTQFNVCMMLIVEVRIQLDSMLDYLFYYLCNIADLNI